MKQEGFWWLALHLFLTNPPAVVKISHRVNALCCPTLHRAVVESVHKLDVIIGSKASYREVFKPENISLRNKYVQLSQ